jgi:hemerythrin
MRLQWNETGGFMKPFKWSKAKAVFIPEIDAEHKTIFRAAEELQSRVEAGAPAADLVPRLKALAEHAESHFEHEEGLMRDSMCPSLEWHKKQHNTVRKRLRQFIPRIEQGEREALTPLMEFLAGWLRDHTVLTDRIMSAHLRNHHRAITRVAS